MALKLNNPDIRHHLEGIPEAREPEDSDLQSSEMDFENEDDSDKSEEPQLFPNEDEKGKGGVATLT